MTRNSKEHTLFNEGLLRREFIAASSTALTLAARLKAAPPSPRATRTLFFNLSHLPTVSANHRLFMAGRSYHLQPVNAGHPLLTRAQASNTFLAALPSSAVTHVVQAVELPTNSVAIGYAFTPTSGGQWEMPSFFMHIPQSAFQTVYQQLSATNPAGQPVPLSAKRMKYGLPPPATLEEFLDEQALMDTANMAAAVVNLHPELLSVVPNSAALIQTQFISARTVFGISNYLETAGPAQPQQSPTAPNPSGWATLVPHTDENGQPLVNTKGANKGLILYDAKWSPTLQTLARPALQNAIRGAKNYVPASAGSINPITLGVDATPGRSNIPDAELTGTIWTRTDGQTSIDQSPGTPRFLRGADNVSYTLTNDTLNYAGYSASLDASNTTDIKLSFVNSYLRFLGVFVQFYKANGTDIVPVSKLPEELSNGAGAGLNTATCVYLGLINPEFTIFGVPIQASTLHVGFSFPTDVASSAVLIASGLGRGSHTYAETEQVGIVLTSLFNLIIPPLLIALGIANQLDLMFKVVVFPFLQTLINEMITIIFSMRSVVQSPGIMATILWRTISKGEVGPGLGIFVTKFLLPFLAEAEVIDSAEDAIPIAGVILQAIGILGVTAEIDETTIEVLSSPWSYKYLLVGTHDLNVTILPDPTHQEFPSGAASCTVTAIFDSGTPHVLQFPVSSAPGPSLSTTFAAVPLGGQVTVHVGIYTADGTQVGHGTAGPMTNDDKAAPSIPITEDLLPINSATQYHHKKKTSLDAQGNHTWVCSAAPAVTAPVGFCENQPGNICSYRSITVSSASNNIGYAWQSYSTASCTAGGSGQLDQLANIGDQNGPTGNAQGNYALIPCSLTPGTHMIYDPSARANSNYYLDTSNNVLRQIELSPPGFVDPRSAQAWGQLNLPSADLLLHPAGTVVSINSANHKLESLKLPPNAVTDAEAGVSVLASVYSGYGSRPGLLDTPTVVNVNAEGVVLVVEAGNNRIHAMDIHGNPVRLFSKQPVPYFLNFSVTGGQGTQYLDVAAEFTGFIYVLSSLSSDQVNYQYRLDIYAADQTGTNPISTTLGFNAARVAVDYWRNVYSLNYEILMMPDGSMPAAGITEPSISQWIPTMPGSCSLGGHPAPIPGPPHGHKPHPRRPYQAARLLRRRDLFRV